MKLYYRAVTQDGKTIRGLIDARGTEEAARYLRKHQFVPIKIVPATEKGLAAYFPFLKRSSASDVVFFTRQLSSMLMSGLTLMQALNVMKNQINNSAMGEIVQNIITDIESGQSFSSAIEKYPRTFSPIYVALIETAESSGLLDKILLRLADNLEKQQKLQRTIRGALVYPILIIVMMIVVITIMMIFVIPQLNVLYGNLNISLPLPTLIVVTISNFSTRYLFFILCGVAAFGYYARKWYRTETGRKIVDTYMLKLPVFGRLISETTMVDFTRTLGLLISSGSLVVESLLKSANTVKNVLYRDAILLSARRVEKGIAVGDAIGASPLFPPMVIEMIKIGEQTGKLDESLMRVSEYYEREVEEIVKTLTTLLEPFIMIILALGVGFLIIAVITPIYSLISSFQ